MITKEELATRTVYASPDYIEMINFLIEKKLSVKFMRKTEKGYKVELWGRMKK